VQVCQSNATAAKRSKAERKGEGKPMDERDLHEHEFLLAIKQASDEQEERPIVTMP
jgi:hypothetical protein